MARRTSAGRPSGSVIVISAPSGSGKSTLVKKLMASVPGMVFSVSYTTRPRRMGEKHGREYFFVVPRTFRRMIAAGEFVEWADVHGELYGTARGQIRKAQTAGKDVLLDIDVQGHRQVRRKIPEAVSIFLLPPSYRELARRLRKRHSDAPEVIRRRLRNAQKEIKHWREYDYLIVNDRLPTALQKLCAVVEAARARRQVQQESVQKTLKTFGGK
ncbi:MAG TPA: guanylate kinase [Terriglobia bacterium]|nr:guanylate kinase [Terriglobia bacterium]